MTTQPQPQASPTDREAIERVRSFAHDIVAEGETAARELGEAGAFIAVSRARLAQQFLALLPSEEPRP